VVENIEEGLNNFGIDYIKAKTWTTDAFYRETEKKIELRKSEGCVTVEMVSCPKRDFWVSCMLYCQIRITMSERCHSGRFTNGGSHFQWL
jgi:hypothetical protein